MNATATVHSLPAAAGSKCDVFIIGGGPAGSTAAALLAERGFRVTVMEKARHPRFHIGESLLPSSLSLFERLGVADEIRAIGMEKWGVEFVSPWHDHRQSFVFADAMDKSMPMAYQVRRADFDAILFRNAARKQARMVEGCEVKQVQFLPNRGGVRIEAQHEDGSAETIEAHFLLDASGRDTFLGGRLQAKHANPKHNSAAIYAHFEGAERRPGRAEGDITIFWFEHGWFWFIPLAKGVTSVGAVAWPYYLKTRKGRALADFFHETIALCPALAARLRGAHAVSPVEATGNYSYVCNHTHGENYLLLGDAYAFVDPVFSSGVMLAMQSAVVGAQTVETCLRHPGQAAAALKQFDRVSRFGPREFSWFIYRVTNPALRNMFMNPENFFRIKEAVLSVLAGDIYGKTPIRGRIRLFKAIYYLICLLNPRRTLRARHMRKHNIRVVEDARAVAN
jgi:flavin-dependent dehydrogenase